jgi:tol-pal system protein YbgF
MIRRSAVAPLLLFAASGCLATKSDIQLLQTEARTSRSQSAEGVAAILRADSVRGRQITQLSATLNRLSDSVRTLTSRFAAFQATANGDFAAMNTQLVQFQALLGQTTRNLQDTRAQIEALREQGTAAVSSAPSAAAAPGDSTQRPPPGTPGQATLYNSANEQLKAGSFRTARTGFELLLNSYPNSEYASAAMLHIGDAYKGDRNSTAADSVYQLVVERYPKSPDAPIALFRRAKILTEANRKDEARALLNRIIKEYPRSDEAILAKNQLTP